jgi:uncharacterized protein YkwD
MKTLHTLVLGLALALVIPASAFANCGAAAARNPSARGASLHDAGWTLLCLLNDERTKHHLRPLRANDMVEHHYFSHDAPSGQNFVQRIFKTDYVPRSARWNLGENLAWGQRRKSTPRAIVRAWMASPGHRHNILTAGFREIGIAIVVGAPVVGVRQAATYATEFGAIHR